LSTPRITNRTVVIIGLAIACVAATGWWSVEYAVEHVLPYALLKPLRELCVSDSGTAMIQVDDTTRLSVKHLRTASNRRGTVIVLHGVAACRTEMQPWADELLAEVFDVLLVDLRAHGRSEGQYCTYGYREKWDTKRCVDWLVNNDSTCTPIGIAGSSLGASVAIQAMSIDPRLALGIAESRFSNLRDVALEHTVYWTGLRAPGVVDRALTHAERIGRFSVDSVAPDYAVRNVRHPLLHVHGTHDERIPFRHAREIEAHAPQGFTEFHAVSGAHHLDVWQVGGSRYREWRHTFLERIAPDH
jgi:pimeloyl-ACP methyl ester carboxylesterase